MMVLAIVSLTGLGPNVLERPHCAQHGATDAPGGHAAGARHGGAVETSGVWTSPASHDCPHCPATDCARVAPCAGSVSTALSPGGVGLFGPSLRRLIAAAGPERADSACPPPDAPPPQPIA